jgi:hypothetical protein
LPSVTPRRAGRLRVEPGFPGDYMKFDFFGATMRLAGRNLRLAFLKAGGFDFR